MTGAIARFLEGMATPEPEFGPHPFWFWNDDLDEGELLRQLYAFHESGVGGVVIHPRTGLSRRVGYLTDAYFRLVRRIVDECAHLGMKVVLYDECSYPSGSACGRVALENPEYAARSLALTRKEVVGPAVEYWRPSLGRSLADRLVCVALARLEGEEGGECRIDPSSLRLLWPEERGLVRIAVDHGRWLAMACIDTPSGGKIRGAHAEQDDGMALAPPAGDLMNPDAVGAFLRLTHDAYDQHLKDHFGSTVVALFTDEPSPLGRGAKRNVRPFTGGFDTWLEAYLRGEHAELAAGLGAHVRAWLPSLWLDFGPLTEPFREAYRQAVHRRIVDVFYRAQADWCRAHGICLTGHPSESNDMASLRTFDWPGQDMVWRWVVPKDASGLKGEHSVAPKAATSGARAGGKRRIAAELLGAYGWRLTLDEVKWLVDWHLVRGNNLLMPHAFFYSVREGRAFESEPDLFLHNAWRPYLPYINRYIARMCKLLTDCDHVCDVAVLGEGRALPWRAAESLFASQIDFLYIDEVGLAEARVDAPKRLLHVGRQAYRAVIVDGRVSLSAGAGENLDAFRACGGVVVEYGSREPGTQRSWIETVRAASASCVRPGGPVPDLRVMHVRKGGVDLFLLANEGEAAISGDLTLPVCGRAVWYDPLWGDVSAANAKEGDGGRSDVSFELEQRQTRILAVDPVQTGTPGESVDAAGGRATTRAASLVACGRWTARRADGPPVTAPAPGDWTQTPALECFSGTLCYRTDVTLKATPTRVEIDLGGVGDIAEVHVNGSLAGIRMWAPYRIETDGRLWRSGVNRLEVRVTNSSANAYEGAMRPSGLLGPVTLHIESIL